MSLNVGIERHGIPVIASVVIDDFAVDIDLELAWKLLSSSAPLSNRETSRLKWGSVLSGTETKLEESSASNAASDKAEAPGPAPPAKPRAHEMISTGDNMLASSLSVAPQWTLALAAQRWCSRADMNVFIRRWGKSVDGANFVSCALI